MSTYSVGELIRYLRKAKGITQKALCAGICDQATMSRVERGTQVLSKYSFDALMQRLGENAENYFSQFVGADDFETFQLRNQINRLLVKHDYLEAGKLIKTVEKTPPFKDGLNLQFLLSAKASILIQSETEISAYKKAMNLLFPAVRVTIPAFKENMIHSYLLTDNEAQIVNNIATCYFNVGRPERAVDIYYEVKTSLEKSFVDFDEKADKYTLVLYNLSKILGIIGRYGEGIEIAETGRKACIRANKARLLPRMVANKAWCLYEIGDKKNCQKLLNQAYYGLETLDLFTEAETIKAYAKDKLNLKINN